MYNQYRASYYPTVGDFSLLQPTSPALKDYFVPFSINQNVATNITFHEYVTNKLQTYASAVN
jgi:hypothetical protein